MPRVETTVSCPVYDSFRVRQIAGMFDVPLAARAQETLAIDLPAALDDWRVGLIVGPSGSGKTTLARRLFGPRVYEPGGWPQDRAVVDGFPDGPIDELTRLLTLVGFSSPPSWLKPYEVLSGGERFRCDLARALATAARPGDPAPTAEPPPRANPGDPRGADAAADPPRPSHPLWPADDRPLVVFDEFTSVVDRQVARSSSAALAKGLRSEWSAARFVAVTCHYDVAEWLEPEWTIDLAAREFHRRRLRRPTIRLQLYRATVDAWALFARHHYLSGQLNRAAQCYLAAWDGAAVAFCATLPLVGRRGWRRVSRLVTLPDYQGLGVGLRLAEAVGDLEHAAGRRLSLTGSHPAVIAHCRRSPRWRTARVMKTGSRSSGRSLAGYRGSAGRAVVSFEYLGERCPS